MKRVTVVALYSDRTWSTSVRLDDNESAIERAVCKLWGRKASFWRDNERPRNGVSYGQIVKWLPKGHCYTSLTGRVRVEVTNQ